MASACLPIPPERFPPPYTWPEIPDPDLSPEFEFFRLEDPPPPTMLPADELFSDGKLVPLHISTTAARSITPPPEIKPPAAVRASIDAFSPRAPTCSIRWRNILRLKKLHLTKPNASNPKTTPSHSPNPGFSNASRSLTSILNRVGSKAPAPKDSDTESVSTSSRLSLSSSSSSSSHDDVVPKQRRSGSGNSSGSSVLADSPRLNSSGKVVFERSSSSPGSFSGGPRYKHGRIERSYSAHVRVAPVLNVPVVCSIRGSSKFGFPLFAVGNSNNNNNNNNNRMPRRNSKNGGIRTEQP